jgi:hypothetical protein
MRRLDFSMKIQTAILTESASDIECADIASRHSSQPNKNSNPQVAVCMPR